MDSQLTTLMNKYKIDVTAKRALSSTEPSSIPSASQNIAHVRKHPIEGKLPIASRGLISSEISTTAAKPSVLTALGRANADEIIGHGGHIDIEPSPRGRNAEREDVMGNIDDFLCYPDSEEENCENTNSERIGERLSFNFADCLLAQKTGLPNLSNGRFWTNRSNHEYGTRHMLINCMFKEFHASIPQMNKVFSSQWLSHDKVVFGTKCNKLMVYDVNKRRYSEIQSLQSTLNTIDPNQQCGIHTIEINQSRTLLATVAKSANDVAIYKLPNLEPICVGEGAHGDWIFDMTWLDDQFLVSGSRDGSLALWRITDDIVDQVTSSDVPSFVYSKPLIKKPCKTADRVRAMCFNSRRSELAVISTNGYIHCWDGLRFKQVMSKRLPHEKENVCLTVDDDSTVYAVGSQRNTDLLDTRTLQKIKSIPARNMEYGTRSISIKGNILTIGTSIGLMYFWDIRAEKYLESYINNKRVASLKASKGWWQRDENFVQNIEIIQRKFAPAIYTHCYDTSGTRLFAAGGPIQCGLQGNYMALFQ